MFPYFVTLLSVKIQDFDKSNSYALTLSGLPTDVFKLEFELTGINLSQESIKLGSS